MQEQDMSSLISNANLIVHVICSLGTTKNYINSGAVLNYLCHIDMV